MDLSGVSRELGEPPFLYAGLSHALKRLDHLLQQALVAAEAVHGPDAAADPYRGLYINRSKFNFTSTKILKVNII
jgi:hypothetical protein